jgi:hypothetical protein
MNSLVLRISSVFLLLTSGLLISWNFKDTYPDNFRIKKDPVSTTVNVGETAKFYAFCRPNQKWQVSKDNGSTWEYVAGHPYRFKKDTLFIDESSLEFDGYLYRIECCKKVEDDDDDDCDKHNSIKKDCYRSKSARLNVYTSLPIYWIDFTSKIKQKTVQLNWYTYDNFVKIEIERIEDTGWNKIGEVSYSYQNQYIYVDENPLDGYNYYRLKGIHYDYSYEYSKIAVVSYNKEKSEIKHFDIYGKEQRILEENRLYFRSDGSGRREKIIINSN